MEIERHIVNLSSGGRLHPSGALHTPASALPARFEGFAAASSSRSLTIYFHGGLVSEQEGLAQARALFPELVENAQSYPLFVLWESGVLETLQGALMEITQSSPIFARVLRKLLKHVARKLPAGAPAFEAAEGEPVPSDLVRAQVESEQLPVGDPAALAALEPPPGAPVKKVTKAEEAALQADLAADAEAMRALDAILEAARRSAPPGVEGAPAPESTPATGFLSGDLLREIEASAPPPGVEAELISAAALWAFAGRILRAVVNRYRAGSDHGLAGTVLEEMYRSMYADRVGSFLWDRIKNNARAAYDDLPEGAAASDDAPGGTLLIRLLRDEITRGGPIDLHLVGHSAGSIHICHFVDRAAAEIGDGFVVKSIALTAPACTCELFMRSLAARSNRIDALRVFTMEDALERRDPLVKWLPLAYPHSLLYLVSGLLEQAPDTALLGLARHVRGSVQGVAATPAEAARAFLAQWPGRLVLARSPEDAPAGARAAFTSHYGEGGPLSDRATLDSIARLVRPAPLEDLQPLEVTVTDDMAAVLEQPAPPPAQGGNALEALIADIGPDDLIDHALVKGILLAGRSVARLVVQGVRDFFSVPPAQRPDAWRVAVEGNALIQGYGTGWIFGRARRLLITNNHVLPLPDAAQGASCEFGYERDLRSGARPQTVLGLDPSAFYLTSPNMAFDSGLDYTLVALSRPAPEDLGYLEPVQGITASTAQNIYIVQHPLGEPKRYVLNHCRKVNVTDRYVTYISDTLEGSSGSPLFDDSLRLVGIHHVGNFKVMAAGKEELTNLGSRIEIVMQDIVKQLRAAGGWNEDRIRDWFGEGPVLALWRATA